MAWVKDYVNWIEQTKLTSDELWRDIKQRHRKAFGTHVDDDRDTITFGDSYDCGYATFNRHTGALIVSEFSPHYNLGESIDELYRYQTPTDIYRRMGFLPTGLYRKYQDMRYALLPVVDLFTNQRRSVDVDYDAKPDGSLATYRLEPSESAQRDIDGIYTAESITDAILKETISHMTGYLTLSDAHRIVKSWITVFGDHQLVLLYIPSEMTYPEASEFPYVLKNVLANHYDATSVNVDRDA